MTEAVSVPDAPRWLSPRCAGLHNAWASPWHVLRRLLLGTDGAVDRGRRYERALDRPNRVTHSLGEGHFFWSPDRFSCWHCSHRGRCVVAVNGNFLTYERSGPGLMAAVLQSTLRAPRADGARTARHSMGTRRIVRQAPALRTMHEVATL